jgi:hypothetical protein
MLALAGNATVAEIAEAAITEKRFRFMAVVLGFSLLILPGGAVKQTYAPRRLALKCFVILATISLVDTTAKAP